MTNPDTTGDLGSVLGVWAHPDDEAYLSACLMMRGLELGHRVVCVTATRGEAGFADDDPRSLDERKALREAELAACLAIYGVTEHHWLGYGDGRCADVPDDEGAERIADIIREVRPDHVLAFAPDGGTGHPDHIATCRWATLGVERAGLPGTRLMYATKSTQWRDASAGNIDLSRVMMIDGFESETWDRSELAVHYTPDDAMLERKIAGLMAQESQIPPFAEHIGVDVFTEFVREEFFRTPRPTDPALIEHTRTFGRTS